jgi:putative flippase GtrA
MKEVIIKHKSKVIYLMVGGWNTLFGYGVFALLYYYLEHKLHSTVILTISYFLSITNAFIGYKVFVFKSNGNILHEYFRFYVVYGGAFIVNLVLLPVFMEVFKYDAYVSQAIITMLTIVGSYMLHNRFTFKRGDNEN